MLAVIVTFVSCDRVQFWNKDCAAKGPDRAIEGYIESQPRVALDATITIFTLNIHFCNTGYRKAMNNMFFGERLKMEREKRGWSQVDLAEKIYVSRQSVSKWETGKNYPSIDVIIELSALFDITIDELLRNDEDLTEKIIQDSKQLKFMDLRNYFMLVVGVLSGILLVSFLKNGEVNWTITSVIFAFSVLGFIAILLIRVQMKSVSVK